MSEIAGRVLMIPKGTYSPTTTYDPLDAVKYEQNSYVCKQTSRGNLPTNTTYWQPLTDVTADEIPTEGSTNLVKSGGVYSANQTLTNQIKDMNNVYGSKNLLPFNISDIIANNTLGTWSGNNYTVSGVTYTVNNDGSITANGTATTNTFIDLISATDLSKLSNKYGVMVMNGCPSGGGTSSYIMLVSDGTSFFTDDGEGIELPQGTYMYLRASIRNGYTAENVKFYPMLRIASIKDDTYVHYAKTNRQLTKDTTGLLDNTEVNGAVNMLPNSFADAVVRGVTLTNNTDGTLNVSGTNDGTGNAFLHGPNFKVPDSGLYKMTGLPGTVAGSSIMDLYLWNVTDSQNVSASATYIQDYIYNLDSSKTYRAIIVVYTGRTVPSGTIIKPMISVASLNLSYADYVPYAKPNKELTDDVTRLDRDAVKIVDSGLIDANSSRSFTCTNFEGYRLSIYSIGSNSIGMVVLFGKHPSVSDIRYSTFNCEDRNPNAPQISISGSTLTITTTTLNCYYVIERIKRA